MLSTELGIWDRTSTSPTFKASLCRSRCLLKKSGLAPHDQTSEGSRALEGAAPATSFQQGWFQKTTRGQQTEGFSPARATLTPQGAQRGPQRGQELEVTCSWPPTSAGWAEDRADHRGAPDGERDCRQHSLTQFPDFLVTGFQLLGNNKQRSG